MPRRVKTLEEIVISSRIAPLVFGFFGWPDEQEEREIKEAGSGVFVAPRLGLSARHVPQSFEKFDSQFDALDRRRTVLDPQYRKLPVKCDFASMIYQIPQFNERPEGEEQLLWLPLTGYASHDTDIVPVMVEPRTKAAREIEVEQRFVEWQLLPPPKGDQVLVYGLPDQKIKVKGSDHKVGAGVQMRAPRVEEHHRFFRHRFGEFPLYELHTELPGGFSGAPVIYNGRLAGIFIGPNLVACLWPLAIHDYWDKDDNRHSFADHFDSGLILACDWNEVKGRVERIPCADIVAGLDAEPCSKTHVALV